MKWARVTAAVSDPDLGITPIYMQGIDRTEMIDTVHARRPPMVPVDTSLLP
jgi:hypothetical protein